MSWRVSGVVHPLMRYRITMHRNINEPVGWSVANAVIRISKVLQPQRPGPNKCSKSCRTRQVWHWPTNSSLFAFRAASSCSAGLYDLSDRHVELHKGEQNLTPGIHCAWMMRKVMKQHSLKSLGPIVSVLPISWTFRCVVDQLYTRWTASSGRHTTSSGPSSCGAGDGGDLFVQPLQARCRIKKFSQVKVQTDRRRTDATHNLK